MAWEIDKKKCIRCSGCVGVCPVSALSFDESVGIVCDSKKCTLCGICKKFCPVGAIEVRKNDKRKL